TLPPPAGHDPEPGDTRGVRVDLDHVDDRDDAADVDGPPQEPLPGPGPAAVHDVVLAELPVVAAEQARPGDDLADEDVAEAAACSAGDERHHERLADSPALVVLDVVVDGGAVDDCDEGRDPRQSTQLVRELLVRLRELCGNRLGVRGRIYGVHAP